MDEVCVMLSPQISTPGLQEGGGANIKGGIKNKHISPPRVAQLVSRHNRLKYQISGPVLHRHRTAFEIAVLLYPNHDYDTNKFRLFYSNIKWACSKCSKKYDPTGRPAYRGYSKPYLSKRSIPGKNNRKRRRGWYEYKLTPKGRRMLCEWNYRLLLGHTDLKWTGEYFNPMIRSCDKNCAACPECMV